VGKSEKILVEATRKSEKILEEATGKTRPSSDL